MSNYGRRRPIGWIVAVVDQLTRESGLPRTAAVEDLVIIVYQGLLDSPDADALSQDRLLARGRSQLVTWAWEQGRQDEEITSLDRARHVASRESAVAPCGALVSRRVPA